MSDTDRVTKERLAQGLPPQITDPIALARVAFIIRRAVERQQQEAAVANKPQPKNDPDRRARYED